MDLMRTPAEKGGDLRDRLTLLKAVPQIVQVHFGPLLAAVSVTHDTRQAISRCCCHGSVMWYFWMASRTALWASGANTAPISAAGVALIRTMRHIGSGFLIF